MSDKISRRDFLKLSGVSAAVAAVLTGCGPAARYVTRKPYSNMPEYNQTGVSTYFATTCKECPAGCGMILRTKEGRAIKAEGNPNHPVNRGKLCSRGQTAVQGLYNPDRIQTALQRAGRGNTDSQKMDWSTALSVVEKALKENPADEIAFLVGLSNDHLYDLLVELTSAMGAPMPVRYSAYGMFEGRATLLDAAKNVFGKPLFPYFDLGNADVVYSFGANFLETYLSPLAFSRGFSQMRRGALGKRGHVVVFEPRMSMTAGAADEWVPIRPGSEGVIAAALGKRIAEIRGKTATGFEKADLTTAAAASDVSAERLEELALLFASTNSSIAVPGGASLSSASTQVILAMNGLVENLNQPGGVYLSPVTAESTGLQPVIELISKMAQGQVKTLFIHGVNPVFELPAALGFVQAMKQVPQVISFSPFEDETALESDYILPDHTPLESFGYQRGLAGSDREIISAVQPVVVPLHDTRATADVFITTSAGKLPYTDEVDFLQTKLVQYQSRSDGSLTAPEILSFWSLFLQNGGWWTRDAGLVTVSPSTIKTTPEQPVSASDGKLHLITYATQMGDGSGANRPWLQETPDPMTTVMWGSWVEMNPDTAHDLGIHDDDILEISSSAGKIEVAVYLYPAIRKDTIAVPFGQGHTHFGRYATGRGANPGQVLEINLNEAGDLRINGTLVTARKTGRRRPVARMESREGVYGSDH